MGQSEASERKDATVGATKQELGLYRKYRVERTDGSSEPGGKHEGCSYFVLDMDHDELARHAILSYAFAAYRAGYEALAADLWEWCRGQGMNFETPAEAHARVAENVEWVEQRFRELTDAGWAALWPA